MTFRDFLESYLGNNSYGSYLKWFSYCLVVRCVVVVLCALASTGLLEQLDQNQRGSRLAMVYLLLVVNVMVLGVSCFGAGRNYESTRRRLLVEKEARGGSAK